MRWGSGAGRAPTARWTSRDSASSAAIWNPVFPPPTTSAASAGGPPASGTRAVQLHHFGAEVSRDRRREGHLKRPGRDHDLLGRVAPVGELDQETTVAGRHGPDAAVELDRQLEALRVIGEVRDDVVAARIAVGRAGKRQARLAVVANRREQPEGIPAGPPSGGGVAGRLQDGEPATLLSQEVADGQPRLATADDHHLP